MLFVVLGAMELAGIAGLLEANTIWGITIVLVPPAEAEPVSLPGVSIADELMAATFIVWVVTAPVAISAVIQK